MSRVRGISVASYSRQNGDTLTEACYALAGPLSLTFFSSILQSTSSIVYCQDFQVIFNQTCTQINAFSVSLGIISAISILLFFISFSLPNVRVHLPEKILYWFSVGLLGWWTLGVLITTFQVTIIPDTRYFSTWLCFFFSGLIAYSEFEQFSSLVDRFSHLEVHFRHVVIVSISSLVVTTASVFACVDVTCNGPEIFGICSGLISFIFCILLFKFSHIEEFSNRLAVVLCLWWTITFLVLTVFGPFRFFGNGFFGCLICFIFSFFVAQAKLFPFSDGFISKHTMSGGSSKNNNDGVERVELDSTLKKSHAFMVSNPNVVEVEKQKSAKNPSYLHDTLRTDSTVETGVRVSFNDEDEVRNYV